MATQFALYGLYGQYKGKLNCSDLIEYQYVPTLPEVLKQMGEMGTSLVILSGCITVAIMVMYIEEAVRLRDKWPLQAYCYTIAALGVFPIASLCFFLTVLMPRSHDVNTTTATLYQPLSMVLFFKLVVAYFGGEDRLKCAFEGKKIPLKGPPFYFLFHWCPTTHMSMKHYYFMKVSIYQLFLAPCFLYFVMGVCTKTGVYVTGQFSFENAHIYIIVCGTISFCIGIYALSIFYKMSQSCLPGYYIRGKYYVLQTFFVVTRLHVIVFDTLGNNQYLPCTPPISAFASGIYMRSALLLAIAFVLSTIARIVFLQNPIFQAQSYGNRNEITAELPLKRFINLFIDYGFNVSFIKSHPGGHSPNGSYFGFFKDFVENRADTCINLTPFGTEYDIISYYTIITQMDFVMVSLTNPAFVTALDVIYSFNSFPLSFSYLLILSMVIGYLLLRKLGRFPLMDYVSLAFGQYFSQAYRHHHKAVAFMLLISLLFVEWLYNGIFSADLTASVKFETIDTFTDIIRAKANVIYSNIFQMESYLNSGVTEDTRDFWIYINRVGINKCRISLDTETIFKLILKLSSLLDNNSVALMPLQMMSSITRYGCIFVPEVTIKRSRKSIRIHASKFYSALMSIPVNRQLENVKESYLRYLYRKMIENGFAHYVNLYFEDLFNPIGHFDYKCEFEIKRIVEHSSEGESSKTLAMGCFQGPLYIICVCIILSLFIWFFELAVSIH